MNSYGGSRYGSSYGGGTHVPRSGFSSSRLGEEAYEPVRYPRSSRHHHGRDYDRSRLSHDTRSRASGRQSTVYPDDSISSVDYQPRRHHESRRDEERSAPHTDDRGRTSRRESYLRPSYSRQRSPSITHAFAYDGTPTWTYHPPTMTEGVPAMPSAPQRYSSTRQSDTRTYDSRPAYRDEPRYRSSRTQSGYYTSTSGHRSRRSDAPSAESMPLRRGSRLPSHLVSLDHRAARPTSAMSWEYTNLSPGRPMPRSGSSGHGTSGSSSRGRGSEMSWMADLDYVQTTLPGL